MFRNPLSDALVVLVILLLFFGPKRLPMLSRSIGESIREFRGGIGGHSEEDDKPQLPAKSETAESGSADPALTGSEPDRETAPVSAERDS
jgi:sec-independent protein translocase protein TatA